MKKWRLVLQFFLALIISLFTYQASFSQEIEKVEGFPETVKIYGAPVKILPSRLNNQPDDLQNPVVPKFQLKLSSGEKFKYGLERAFINPSNYIFPAIKAIRQEIDENRLNKDTDDKVADGLSRYAINYGTSSSKALLVSGVYPILFKQNPHYKPSTKRGFGPRILHAASQVFVTQGDSGNLQFNYSRMAGDLSASALANLWERNTPKQDRIGIKPTFRRFGNMITFDVVSFVVIKEFGPDIKRFFLRR